MNERPRVTPEHFHNRKLFPVSEINAQRVIDDFFNNPEVTIRDEELKIRERRDALPALFKLMINLSEGNINRQGYREGTTAAFRMIRNQAEQFNLYLPQVSHEDMLQFFADIHADRQEIQEKNPNLPKDFINIPVYEMRVNELNKKHNPFAERGIMKAIDVIADRLQPTIAMYPVERRKNQSARKFSIYAGAADVIYSIKPIFEEQNKPNR